MSGGQCGVPLVIRMATGAGKQLAAQHSHSLEGWFAHIPGIKILAPATVADARAMLAPALADPDPVLIFENVMLYNRKAAEEAEVAASPESVWQAALRRTGKDVTRRAVAGAGGGGGTGRGGDRGGRHRPARPAPAGRRHHRRLGRQDPPRRRHRRRLAQRQPGGGGLRPHHGKLLLVIGCAGRAGLRRRGADPLSAASGAGLDPAAGRDRRGGQARAA
jgi:hypothetical protein